MGAAYKFDFKHPSYLNFYNSAKKNAQGVRRGYRVQLNKILHGNLQMILVGLTINL